MFVKMRVALIAMLVSMLVLVGVPALASEDLAGAPATDAADDVASAEVEAEAETEALVRQDLQGAWTEDAEGEGDSDSALGSAGSADSTALVAQSSEPTVTYGVHRQTYGDQTNVSNGAVAGTTGQSKRLEALWISVRGGPSGGVQYRAHVQSIGWQGWKSNGQKAGTTGQAKRLEAVEIRLTGDIAKSYDVYYRVHAQRLGWMKWAKNGETAGTAGMAWRLEALQVVLVKKGGSAPGKVAGVKSVAPVAYLTKPDVNYRVHVQTYGWQDWQSNGESAGTTGQAKRLEALEATLGGGTVSGDMEYRTHVQSIGWQGWVANGATAGTTGQAKRLEAACIRLTGLAERYFDVWYRVHSQTYGWMGWTKNGAPAGTEGLSKRLEAIQVVIKPKGSVAPGSTVGSFRNTPRSLVMVGDSRTLGTYEALYGTSRVDDIIVEECDGNGTWWIMRNGAGYNWLNLAAASSVDGRISADSSVVIWLGVNDIIGFDQQMEILQYSDEAHYAELINSKAREWTSRGAMVYYATVGPLGSTGGTDYYSVPYTNRVVSDAQVRSWNSNLVPLLSSDVRVIDAYGALVGNFATSEGLHYDDATYLRYYEFVRRSVL